MRGSDHVGADEAPEHNVKMGTEIDVTTNDVLREQQHGLDVIDAIVLPQLEPMVHIDSDDHSDIDNDSDGEPVGHLYPFLVLSDDVDSEDEVVHESFKRQTLGELKDQNHNSVFGRMGLWMPLLQP
ncbi:hypothetical protein D1007_52857 [Hordeum vulgare]|nr:hypothetical protein D1007_52857 [Hordeum vulgare]